MSDAPYPPDGDDWSPTGPPRDPAPFVCVDCDCEVHRFGGPAGEQRERCGPCQWIAELPPADRERCRAWLKEIDA